MSSSQCSNLNLSLAQAVDLFLMRQFTESFDLCKEIILAAKNEPEQERNEEVIEAATALGIQALAESDAWNETLSFVTDVYGAIDFCPPRIIQVSLLLHAHMREYLLCHKLVQSWLQNSNNLDHKMCSQVIRVYTHHVLTPSNSFDTWRQIVNNSPSLTPVVKSTLLEQVFSQIEESKRFDSLQNERRISQTECSHCNSALREIEDRQLHSHGISDDDEDSTNDAVDDENDGDNLISKEARESVIDNIIYSPVQSAIMSTFEAVCSFVKNRINILQNKHVQLALMAVLAVIALFHSQTGDPVSSLGRLVVLWKGFLQRLGLLHIVK